MPVPAGEDAPRVVQSLSSDSDGDPGGNARSQLQLLRKRRSQTRLLPGPSAPGPEETHHDAAAEAPPFPPHSEGPAQFAPSSGESHCGQTPRGQRPLGVVYHSDVAPLGMEACRYCQKLFPSVRTMLHERTCAVAGQIALEEHAEGKRKMYAHVPSRLTDVPTRYLPETASGSVTPAAAAAPAPPPPAPGGPAPPFGRRRSRREERRGRRAERRRLPSGYAAAAELDAAPRSVVLQTRRLNEVAARLTPPAALLCGGESQAGDSVARLQSKYDAILANQHKLQLKYEELLRNIRCAAPPGPSGTDPAPSGNAGGPGQRSPQGSSSVWPRAPAAGHSRSGPARGRDPSAPVRYHDDVLAPPPPPPPPEPGAPPPPPPPWRPVPAHPGSRLPYLHRLSAAVRPARAPPPFPAPGSRIPVSKARLRGEGGSANGRSIPPPRVRASPPP
eukprot:TRINITY_DN3864_c4_g1_i1.p1 TRINITY_DN3864_c4_g1~~TRINITY_DN3864_c4_g1_i1.p1  ORF type:complete len:489 (+),score=117.69 TRINITY_DN3864_c4_g1_i1:133-1467(+)